MIFGGHNSNPSDSQEIGRRKCTMDVYEVFVEHILVFLLIQGKNPVKVCIFVCFTTC